MAFATGHVPPTGFVAGQLTDGAVFGTFTVGNFGTPPQSNVKIKVTLRFFKGLLIGMTQAGSNDAIDSVEGLRVKGQEYFKNLKDYPGITGVTAFTNLIPLLATNSQLAALGIADNALTLGATSGGKIPYQQDADGQVTAYVDPAVTQTALNTAITKLANGATTTLAADGSTTPAASTVNWKSILMYVGIGAVVIVGGIFLMKSLKKKGKAHGKK